MAINDPLKLGIGLDCILDMPLRWNFVSSNMCLANSLVRRLTTPRSFLTYINPEYGPDYGYDIRMLLNISTLSRDLSFYQSMIINECEKDERVNSCQVSINYNPTTSTAIYGKGNYSPLRRLFTMVFGYR